MTVISPEIRYGKNNSKPAESNIRSGLKGFTKTESPETGRIGAHEDASLLHQKLLRDVKWVMR